MSKLLETAKENLTFLLVAAIVVVAIALVAWLAQHFLCKVSARTKGARRIVFTAIFAAVGAVLMLFEIPLFFAPSFYKMDLSELPVLMCSFYLGPTAGVICELLKVVLKLLLKGTTTAFVGDFANFVVGCTLVLPASIIYHFHNSKKSAVVGMLVGTLIMAAFGSLFNAVYLLPKFAELYGLPMEVLIGMGTAVNPAITSVSTLALYAVVPFNLLKGIVVSVFTFLLYKRLESVLFRKAK
ncbi:MAG: ECF transporter S component [Oscillospiraceae bacterium]|nr:ECF transporter S component [Oscillospiraceae bacterium]